MKEGLELLYQLQKKDDQIKGIEELIRQIPRSIGELEQERDERKEIIEAVKQKRDDNLRQREVLEKDILLIKEKMKKYREQMNKSTTNKEYQGFISEIKFEEKRISEVEERIIQRMLEFDDIMEEIREREKEYQEIAAAYNQKIAKLKENLAYNENKLKEETATRSGLRKQIPESLLFMYDALYKNKGGKAVSLIETEFCGICNIKIRPQLLNEVISTDQVFICESCGRILFKKITSEEERAAK